RMERGTCDASAALHERVRLTRGRAVDCGHHGFGVAKVVEYRGGRAFRQLLTSVAPGGDRECTSANPEPAVHVRGRVADDEHPRGFDRVAGMLLSPAPCDRRKLRPVVVI